MLSVWHYGLSPGRHQAIVWTNSGILLIGTSWTNFSEILIEIHIFSCKKMHLKMSSGKWLPFCLSLNVLNAILTLKCWFIMVLWPCPLIFAWNLAKWTKFLLQCWTKVQINSHNALHGNQQDKYNAIWTASNLELDIYIVCWALLNRAYSICI